SLLPALLSPACCSLRDWSGGLPLVPADSFCCPFLPASFFSPACCLPWGGCLAWPGDWSAFFSPWDSFGSPFWLPRGLEASSLPPPLVSPLDFSGWSGFLGPSPLAWPFSSFLPSLPSPFSWPAWSLPPFSLLGGDLASPLESLEPLDSLEESPRFSGPFLEE